MDFDKQQKECLESVAIELPNGKNETLVLYLDSMVSLRYIRRPMVANVVV
jgi:hypothetical protein